MKLSQIRALVGVADWGNFSEAALHLDLSQSAISHAIATLEQELGVMLIVRGRMGASLTPVGERVTQHARQILQLVEAMQKEASLERGLQGGQVRIACFRSVATHLLPAVIARFRERYPAIGVVISEYPEFPQVEQALREGQADLGFIYLPTTPEFEAWELLRDDYIALLPPDPQDPSDGNQTITWEQLEAYPLIMDSGGDTYLGIRYHLNALGRSFKIAYEVREDSTIVSMVAQGLGASIRPRLAAEPIPADIRVRHLPVPLQRVIGVAMLAGALQTPAVFAFWDLLKHPQI
jgi:DNA-binding transcriptional LysR family regulator